jgi:hypothetical protein
VEDSELLDPVDVIKMATFWLSAPCSYPQQAFKSKKRYCFCMMQLVRVALTLAQSELETSFWAHLKTKAYHWKWHVIIFPCMLI